MLLVFVINLVIGMKSKEPGIQKTVWIGFIVLAVLVLVSIFRNCYSVRLFATFMKAARQVVAWRWRVLFYILLYLVLLDGIIKVALMELYKQVSFERVIVQKTEVTFYQAILDYF